MQRLAALAAVLIAGCSGGPDDQLASAPDGTHSPEPHRSAEFAFTSRAKGRVGIYHRWSNGKLRWLTPAFGIAEAPDWAPDGKWIVFQAKVDDNYDIYTLDIESNATTRLTRDSASDLHPAWSPDGSTIAFMSDRAGEANASAGGDPPETNVYLVSADGKDLRRFTRALSGTKHPAWSPDGQSIAFSAPSRAEPALSTDTGKTAVPFTDIYVARKTGGGIRRLTDGKAFALYPAWSPDATRIAFCSNRNDDPRSLAHVQIYVMQADGSNRRSLTQSPAQNLCPDWSPHGDRILFHSLRSQDPGDRKGTSQICVVNADGSSLTRWSANLVEGYFPAWRPEVENSS